MPTILPIQNVDPKTLKPYPGNPRKRIRASRRKLAHAIRKYGFTNPIVCDENWVILAGHGRCDAALALELETVPVIQIVGLREQKKSRSALPITASRKNRHGHRTSWRSS